MRKWNHLGWVTAFAALLALLIAAPVVAQEVAGGIDGNVVDEGGQALPGVTIEATGPLGTVAAVTDEKGFYRLPKLPAGTYSIKASLEGFVASEASGILVVLGKSTRVNFTMKTGQIEETITVTADSVAIDFTSSATAASISREDIDTLPRGRDFTSVVSQAAGVQESAQAGGLSIDGASGLENRFIIDGIDTTSPQTGESAVPMRADFFEEVQIKSAGYAAEFGGSTGGVINAITRSGRNEFSGGIAVDYQSRSLNGAERKSLSTDRAIGLVAQYFKYGTDDSVRWDPGIFLGGPIVRDRVWFFGSYQPGLTDTDRTVQFYSGATPTVKRTFNQKQQVDYYAANITGNLGPVLFKLGTNQSPWERERALPGLRGTGSSDPSSYDFGGEGERETYSLTTDYIASKSVVLSARVGYFMTDLRDTGIPSYPRIHQMTGTDPSKAFPNIPAQYRKPIGYMGDGTQALVLANAVAWDKYERTYYGGDASFFFSGGGEHQVKVGFQREEIENDVRNGYNADRIMYYWDRAYTTTTGQSVRGTYGYFRLLNISTMGHVKTTNDALFLQDTWMVTPKFTLNLGVRAELEAVPNYGAVGPSKAIEFKYGDKIAPRAGFAWDLKGDQSWKVYGSYGTYYDVTKYEMPRGAFGGDKWVDFYYTFDNYDWINNNCSVGSNTTNERPNCPAGTLIEVVDRRHNSADPNDNTIDPDIKPMESWEAQLGVDHQLTSLITVGARYVHKQLVRAIEDVGVLVPGIGEVYYIANPGYGVTRSIAERPFPKAQREYDAIELTFDRRLANNWSLRASYTYSRLWGNYSGLANSDEQNTVGGGGRLSPNASRLFDVIQNTYDRNGKEVLGRLATDKPHQLKVFGTYRFPFNLTVGLGQYVGSGVPVTEIGWAPINTPFYPYGRGNLGRTPTVTQTDLALYQDFKVGAFDLQVGLSVLNLFDEKTVLRRWGSRTLQDLPLSEEEFFAGGWDYETLVRSVQPDPLYNKADVFQAPRELRLSFKVTF